MDVREKLAELLENHCAVIGEDHCKASQSGKCTPRDCAICLASDLISNGVTVQEWIPVTERLPEKYQTVVGWCKDNPFSKYKEEIVCWNGKGWVFLYGQRYVTNVTHWMPLPSTEGLK